MIEIIPPPSAVGSEAELVTLLNQYDAVFVLFTRVDSLTAPKGKELPSFTTFQQLLTTNINDTMVKVSDHFIQSLVQGDQSFKTSVTLHHIPIKSNLPESALNPCSRILFCPTGPLDGDVDDCRRFADAVKRGVVRCISAGIKRPLVLFVDPPTSPIFPERIRKEYASFITVSLLSFLNEVYVPLQAREHAVTLNRPHPNSTIQRIGILTASPVEFADYSDRLALVQAIDVGKIIAKDVGGSDPERMAPLKCAEYLMEAFGQSPNIKMTILSDWTSISKEYPLLAAVSRGSIPVPRHWPVVVRLDYISTEPTAVREHLYFVGKGVTYDTGGADIKYGGAMRGMSRDKCGASACAGFMKALSILQPKHINATAFLGFVRNSSGADNYVSDEVLISRAQVRVLVGNTDAEGRMVMGDLLAHAKELALRHPTIPARLFTVATLTGHAVKAVGPYTISLDNGPAREAGISKRLFEAGHRIGDPFETSTLRREDYDLIVPSSGIEDVCQANDKPSTQTARGHQYPAAFLSVVSGISKCGLDSPTPIAYTHIDCAGSAEEMSSGSLSLPRVTGRPVAGLVEAFCKGI